MNIDSPCPICGFQGIEAGPAKCPQCDADLSCFRVLDSLPDIAVSQETFPRPGRFVFRAGIFILVSVFLGGLLVWMFRDEQVQSPATHVQIYPVRIKIDMEAELKRGEQRGAGETETTVSVPAIAVVDEPEMKEGSEGGERELPAAEEKKQGAEKIQEKVLQESDSSQESRFLVHRTTGDETLWRIAQKYYGTGYYFPVLLRHNPGMGIYDLRKDLEIRILRDASQAEQVYKEITTVNGSRIYYLHAVEEGDTLESIARRFYGTEAGVDRIRRLNPDAGMKPGDAIRIELE